MELYTAATSDIVASTNELESLTRDWQSVEADNALKLSELDDLRDQLAEISENKTELSGRSRALRAKIHNVDEDIRNKSDRVKSEIRKYFRQLGIRVEQEELNEKENHIEIRITLKDESNASFCLAYDLVSEDFHLLSIQPEHQRFDELHDLLQRTRDLPAFIAMFRKFYAQRSQQ